MRHDVACDLTMPANQSILTASKRRATARCHLGTAVCPMRHACDAHTRRHFSTLCRSGGEAVTAPSHAKTPVADRSFQFQWFASTTRTLAAPRVLAHRGAPCSQSALRASSSGICGSCLSRRAKCWPKASLFTQRLRRHPSPTTDPGPNTGPNQSRADPGRRATAHPRK